MYWSVDNHNDLNWQGCCQVRTGSSHFFIHCNWNNIPVSFSSTLSMFLHKCRHFYFRALYHSMRQKRLACWFCSAKVFSFGYFVAFFFLQFVWFILLFRHSAHLSQVSYCMHIMYHIIQILLQTCTRLLPSV